MKKTLFLASILGAIAIVSLALEQGNNNNNKRKTTTYPSGGRKPVQQPTRNYNTGTATRTRSTSKYGKYQANIKVTTRGRPPATVPKPNYGNYDPLLNMDDYMPDLQKRPQRPPIATNPIYNEPTQPIYNEPTHPISTLPTKECFQPPHTNFPFPTNCNGQPIVVGDVNNNTSPVPPPFIDPDVWAQWVSRCISLCPTPTGTAGPVCAQNEYGFTNTFATTCEAFCNGYRQILGLGNCSDIPFFSFKWAFSPVCGTTNFASLQTYANAEVARRNDAYIIYNGCCKNCICTMEYAPVCAYNYQLGLFRAFDNNCQALCFGFISYSNGTCPFDFVGDGVGVGGTTVLEAEPQPEGFEFPGMNEDSNPEQDEQIPEPRQNIPPRR